MNTNFCLVNLECPEDPIFIKIEGEPTEENVSAAYNAVLAETGEVRCLVEFGAKLPHGAVALTLMTLTEDFEAYEALGGVLMSQETANDPDLWYEIEAAFNEE